jgi:tellurite resistance protein
MAEGLLDVFRPEQERRMHGRHAGPADHALPTVLSGVTYDGWVPAGVAIEIAGLTLPGGMLYVGKELRAPAGGGSDPALIDPRLAVDCRNPDWSGSTVGYWPSYSSISAQARGAYLTWLAGGRSHPGVPISWVFLFFYGLERRVIVDAADAGPAAEDRQPIAAEVRRLLAVYGGDSSFHYYATQFLLLIEALSPRAGPPGAAPPRTASSWFIPLQLRSGLGRYAAEGRPVPADWALSWAHFHPDIYPRTPAQRCPSEFEQLFRARYAMRHGAGLEVQPENILHRHTYVAASPGIRQVSISSGLPDVLQLTAPTTALKALVEECTDALDAYSRYLGRHPAAKGTLPATALLPAELVDRNNSEVLRLTAWVDERLGQHRQAVVDGRQLCSFWPAADPGNLAKAGAVSFAQLLGTLGVGVEPDVRLGGPVLNAGPAVIFRAAPGQPAAPSAAYAAATLVLHLAAAVSLAGGRASGAERAQLRSGIAAAMHLTEPERVRLAAHLEWLLAGEARLTGISRRLDVLEQPQRESIADLLVTVAAADGVISPAEITALIKIFRLLGLDSASVYSRAHAVTATSAPATEPVIVRPGTEGPRGLAVPPRPAGQAATTTGTTATQSLRLDEAAIAAKLAETAAVSALLGSIFAEETPRPEPAGPGTRRDLETRESPVAGLDAPHSALLRALARRDTWSRADLEAECAAVALLPDGALDTLNEAAYEAAGDPLAEGEDPIDINPEVAREMLA